MKKLILLIVAVFVLGLVNQFYKQSVKNSIPVFPSPAPVSQTVTPTATPTETATATATLTPTITKPKLAPIRIRHEDE